MQQKVLSETVSELLARLKEEQLAAGHWRGNLASSALATATGVCALSVCCGDRYRALVERGLAYLAAGRNRDGGWGDTPVSGSNISTTTLCVFALRSLAEGRYGEAVRGGTEYLARNGAFLTAASLCEAIERRYGKDKTFSVPILTMGAVTGCLGWEAVRPLPFELAWLPRGLFRYLRLPVVSYAVPALIAVGQARFVQVPPRNPIVRWIRKAARGPTLQVLRSMQPQSGGFLEAIPITSFVAMSLGAAGLRDHPVVESALTFIRQLARPDGSWPIERDLATWVTTLAIQALTGAGYSFSEEEKNLLLRYLLVQQHRQVHPYTRAQPGGWAWTDAPGGVPDADDTAGALIALHCLCGGGGAVWPAVWQGIRWLCDLQNADGGIPTFCRGWGHLPFDRSGPDLTAHALRALCVWLPEVQRRENARAQARVLRRAGGMASYIVREQREDGSWVGLWFGNEGHPNEENPTYGTARVTVALLSVVGSALPLSTGEVMQSIRRAARWLLGSQHADGGWGGGSASSIEETGLACEALASVILAEGRRGLPKGRSEVGQLREALRGGCKYLIEATEGGTTFTPAAIGLYFARLWYYERLYPVIFSLFGLAKGMKVLSEAEKPA